MEPFRSSLEQWNSLSVQEKSRPGPASQLLDRAEAEAIRPRTFSASREAWMTFLDLTRKPEFLGSLDSEAERIRWAELVFRVLQRTNYTLRDMMEQRVAAHPDRALFRELRGTGAVDWSYVQIYRHLREIATVFYASVREEPR
ncbi:MAG TPA: hypothetical protein VMC08_04030, partial [Bacteroidales bacterium]|nr:hypothetical protein [Bacteroidales bacterium]